MNKGILVWICATIWMTSGCSIDMEDTSQAETVSVTRLVEATTQESGSDIEIEMTDQETMTDEEGKMVSKFTVETPMLFSIQKIDEQMAQAMTGKSFHENTHIQLEDLRVVNTGYYGFDQKSHQGSIIVHEVIAEDILAIFMELYDLQYPIEQLTPIDQYQGDDDLSMLANNSSAFNYRVIAGTDRLSKHAYGLAVDINPLVNPWVTSTGVYPAEGAQYADRTMDQQGMIKEGDACYTAFTSRGFEWGGDWTTSKDYQHFDIKIEGINQ